MSGRAVGIVGIGGLRIGRTAELNDARRGRWRGRRRRVGARALFVRNGVLDRADALIELVVFGLHPGDLLAHLGELPVCGSLGPSAPGKRDKGRAEGEADS